MLADLLRAAGCEVDGPIVVPDGAPVEVALRQALEHGYDVIVSTGGTGLTPTDMTPEMTRLVVDREIPGITGGALDSNEGEPGPFYIQGDHTGEMKFRNITVQLPKG